MKKKLIILCNLIIICFSGYSQTVHVSGYVKNIIGNTVIPNHMVIVRLDTINHRDTLYTDINGFYSDSIPNQLQKGKLLIHTLDCNGVSIDSLKQLDTIVRTFYVNFFICDSFHTACHADFVTDTITGNIVQFYDNSTGTNIYSWQWNFGDGTTDTAKNPNHYYSHYGTFNVCLIISADSSGNSCSDTICKSITIINQTKYNLGGQVFAGTYPVKWGFAYLYNNITNLTDYLYFDTLGYYYFPQIFNDNYIVKIIPDSSSCIVTQYAPTYYGNTLFWEQATRINFNDSVSAYDKDINLILTSPSSGLGAINGDYRYNGTLKPCSEILLLDINKSIITYLFTDANGNFNFNNIAYGTYILHAEDAGITANYETLTISANNPIASAQLFNQTLGVPNYNDITSLIKISDVFPNPVQQELNIDVELAYSSNLIIELYNILGKKIIESSYSLTDGKHTITIPVDEISKGIYFIHISSTDNNFSEVRKLIK